MALELVQDSDDQCRFEVGDAGGDAAGEDHVAGSVSAVFQHAVLFIEVIQEGADFFFLVAYSDTGSDLYLQHGVYAVVQEDHEGKVGAFYSQVAAECLGMDFILEILEAKALDLVFFQIFLECCYFFFCYGDFYLICHFLFSFAFRRTCIRLPIPGHVALPRKREHLGRGGPVFCFSDFETKNTELFQDGKVGGLVHKDHIPLGAFDALDLVLDFLHGFSFPGNRAR